MITLLKRSLWACCILVVCLNANTYRLGVERRTLTNTWTWTYSDSPDGRYTLAFGEGYGNWVWVKLRKKGGNEVLADRWFYAPFTMNAFWDGDRVFFRKDTADAIYLPPIWVEKWLAKLP